jgi:hypothetical protein
MNPLHEALNHLTRRQFFSGAGLALGGVALNWLAPRLGAAGAAPGAAPGSRVHPALAGLPALCPDGEAHHLPAHERRALAARHV